MSSRGTVFHNIRLKCDDVINRQVWKEELIEPVRNFADVFQMKSKHFRVKLLVREVQLVDALEVGGVVILVAAWDVAVAAAAVAVDVIRRRHFFVDLNVRCILFFVDVL